MQRTLVVSARKSKKLSQSALAKLIHTKASHISRLELGYVDPTPAEAQALQKVLGLSLADLDVGLERGPAQPPVKMQPPVKETEPKPSVSPVVAKTAEGPVAAVSVKPVTVQTTPPFAKPMGLASSQAAQSAGSGTATRSPFGVTVQSVVADFEKEPDLSAPAMFAEVPDESVLDVRGGHPDTVRRKLGKAIAYGNKILHTSRIPAGSWLRWNQFVKTATAKLREIPQV